MDEKLTAGTDALATDGETPPFEPPRVLTFRGDELLQLLGPALACTSFTSTMCAPAAEQHNELGGPLGQGGSKRRP